MCPQGTNEGSLCSPDKGAVFLPQVWRSYLKATPNVVGAAVGSEATHRPSRAWPPLPRSAREQEGHLHPPLLHDLQTTAMDVFPCVRDCVSPSHLLPK